MLEEADVKVRLILRGRFNIISPLTTSAECGIIVVGWERRATRRRKSFGSALWAARPPHDIEGGKIMNKHLVEKKAIARHFRAARKRRNIARNPQSARKDVPVFVKSFNPYPHFYRTFKTRWLLLARVDPVHWWAGLLRGLNALLIFS